MADETASPISEAGRPATGAPVSTAKLLKPVIRKPGTGGARPMAAGLLKPVAPAPAPAATPEPAKESATAAGSALAQLKGVTQKLKGVTQQIPQQAILHKTGIIADQDLTEAQKQASKSRTARISLSDAIGAAPVQNDAAPMKTIRIKRPVGLQQHAEDAASAAEPTAAEPPTTATQRKTLKIARPSPGGARPTSRFGVKKPADAAGEESDVQDIPDMPVAGLPPSGGGEQDVPSGLLVFDLILQVAACAAVGFLGWLLYCDLGTQWF